MVNNTIRDVQETMETELFDLLSVQQWAALGPKLARYPAADVAEFLERLDPGKRSILFRGLPRDLASEVFAELDSDRQEELLHDLTGAQTRELLASLPPDDRTALLAELPANVTQRLLTALSPEDLAEARQLLGYPEDSVGRLMTPDFIAVQPGWTVRETLDYLRRQGRDAETFDVVYVADAQGNLLDDIRLRQIVLADLDTPIEALMDHSSIALRATDDREEAVRGT